MRSFLSFKDLFLNKDIKYRYYEPISYSYRFNLITATALLVLGAGTLAGILVITRGGHERPAQLKPKTPGYTLIVPAPAPATSGKALAATTKTASPRPLINNTISHENITTTVFWIGEKADQSNGFIANSSSAWDEQWQAHYGGYDDPNNRQSFSPAAFIPQENPFYFALPYDDLTTDGKRKPTAGNCPNSQAPELSVYSWCKNSWIKIAHGPHIAYAQWEDVGPFEDDDVAYVFGNALPKNNQGASAGLDVSPAVRDYLILRDVDKCSWSFVDAAAVPDGPWKQTVTVSKGYSLD